MYYSELIDIALDSLVDMDANAADKSLREINEQVERFAGYVNLLDTASIRTVQSNKQKIAEYWNKFSQLASGLEDVLQTFREYREPLNAELTELKYVRSRMMDATTIINNHRKRFPKTGSDAIQSVIIIGKIICTFDEIIAKENRSLRIIDDICSTGTTAFQQAILINEAGMDFALLDISSYIKNYDAVKAVLPS